MTLTKVSDAFYENYAQNPQNYTYIIFMKFSFPFFAAKWSISNMTFSLERFPELFVQSQEMLIFMVHVSEIFGWIHFCFNISKAIILIVKINCCVESVTTYATRLFFFFLENGLVLPRHFVQTYRIAHSGIVFVGKHCGPFLRLTKLFSFYHPF